MAMKITYKL